MSGGFSLYGLVVKKNKKGGEFFMKRFTVEEKGKLIESTVINMFLSSGLKIFENGVEMRHHDFYNHFMEKRKNGTRVDYDPRLRQLLSMPDFLVENLQGKYDFIEVKYRSIHYLPKDVGDDLVHRINLIKHFHQCRTFWKPEIILVTDEPLETTGMFTVISAPYFEDKEGETRLIVNKITDIKRWGITEVTVSAYERLISIILAG